MSSWDSLSMAQRADIMKLAVQSGIYKLNTIREAYNGFALGGNINTNKFEGGGDKGSSEDSRLLDYLIQKEGFIEHPRDIGDGVLTLGSGLTAKKWLDLYHERGNVWSEEDNRRAVTEEINHRRDTLSKTFPNFNTLPPASQDALISYDYNVGISSSNHPSLYKAAAAQNWNEAVKEMNATSKNPKFVEGLQKRRDEEQAWFKEGLQNASKQSIVRPKTTQVYQPVTKSSSIVNAAKGFVTPQTLPKKFNGVQKTPQPSNWGLLPVNVRGGGGNLFTPDEEEWGLLPLVNKEGYTYNVHPSAIGATEFTVSAPDNFVTVTAPTPTTTRGQLRSHLPQVYTPEDVRNLATELNIDPGTLGIYRIPHEKPLEQVSPEFALLTLGRAGMNGGLDFLSPGSVFWNNPITKQIAASELGGNTVDVVTDATTPYNSWNDMVLDVTSKATGQNLQDSGLASTLADMTNFGYLTPYGFAEGMIKGAANSLEGGMRFLNSPLTGNSIKPQTRTRLGVSESAERIFQKGNPAVEWAKAGRTPNITLENAALMTDAQWDAAYNAALKAGNKAEIQRLRDLHFKAKSNTKIADLDGTPKHIYHGTNADWTSYDPKKFGSATDEGYYGVGLYGTEYRPLAKGYGDNIMDLYINSKQPFTAGTQDINGNFYTIDEAVDRASAIYHFNRGNREGIKFNPVTSETNFRSLLQELDNADAGVYGIPNQQFNEVVVPHGEQAKFANPITFDDAGNVIPLSKRDNFKINDLRYSLLPIGILGGATLKNR